MSDLIRNDPIDVVKHIRQNVSSGLGQDPVCQYQTNISDGRLSIGLRTSLLGEEIDLIEDRKGISILEVAAHDADYFRRHPDSDEQIELILQVNRLPDREE
jgi:hypothetical protein